MRTNILQSVALSLGICTCGVAQAQYGGYGPNPAYRPANPPAYAASAAPVHPTLQPASQPQVQPRDPYRLPPPEGTPYRLISTEEQADGLPAPVGSGAQTEDHSLLRGGQLGRPAAGAAGLARPGHGGGGYVGSELPAPPIEHGYPSVHGSMHHHPADGSSGHVGHVYNEAAAAPWIGSGPGLLHGGSHHGGGPLVEAAAPIKNWFAGGSLLFLDFQDDGNQRLVVENGMPPVTLLDTDDVSPGSETGFETFVGRYFGGGKYAVSAGYFFFDPDREESIINPTVPVESIHGAFDNAAAYRVRRDVDIQGLELNFISFGIGGAMRAGLAGDCGSCGVAGCGGMCRPMIPSCDNRFQLQVSHGLRWLQFKDDMELAASMAANGYDAGGDDFFYDVETQNDLLGYQFGTRADYCVHRRVNLYAGGKFGIYGNRVDYEYSWIDTGMPGDNFEVDADDTVLATLGELDLGVGVRLTDCWSLTGGYRLIGATNVATSVSGITADPADLEDGVVASANDSLLIHGGYVGVQYNW